LTAVNQLPNYLSGSLTQSADSNGWITEIIVTDRLRLNAGVSEITTGLLAGAMKRKFPEVFFNRTKRYDGGQLEL